MFDLTSFILVIFVKFIILLSCITICMQKKFEDLVRDKIGEPSNVENEDVNGEHGNEHSTPNISLADDATLFYKAVGGSKKDGCMVLAQRVWLWLLHKLHHSFHHKHHSYNHLLMI